MAVVEGGGRAKAQAVIALVRTADQRKHALDDAKTIQRHALELHTSERARARTMHREANLAFMNAVDAARASGMAVKEIAGHAGLSVPTIGQIRRTLATWDTQHGEEEEP